MNERGLRQVNTERREWQARKTEAENALAEANRNLEALNEERQSIMGEIATGHTFELPVVTPLPFVHADDAARAQHLN